MSDLKKYTDKRKEKDKDFSLTFDEGYQDFKIGAMLKEARKSAGETQEGLTLMLKKSQ